MAKKKKAFDSRIPPCPDPLRPERYKLVEGKYKYHWQRKRGTVKPATLNASMSRSAELTKPTNDASKRLMAILTIYTQHMELGRVAAQIAGAFKKAVIKNGRMDFSYMKDLEFQDTHRLQEQCQYITTKIEKDTVQVNIPVGYRNVKKLSNVHAGYELQAILIFGDPAKEGALRIDTERSRRYTFAEKKAEDCHFSFVLPPKNRPWMLLVYIEGHLNVKTTVSPVYRRMQVVRTSEAAQ